MSLLSSDLYALFDVPPNSDLPHIRTRYRRLALLYHPDKNNGDDTKFLQLQEAFHVLSDPQLREQYDAVRFSDTKAPELEAAVDSFRRELLRDELLAQKRTAQPNVDHLSQEGAMLRRKMEAKLQAKSNVYVSYEQIPIPRAFSFAESHTVQVWWKHKAEVGELFNADVLKEIMSIFGPISNAQVSPATGSRYDHGSVEYLDEESVRNAVDYDYKSASKWDGTRVRKLASLIRGAKRNERDERDER